MNEPSQRRSSSKQIAGGSQQDIAKLAGPAEPIVSEIPFDQDHGQTSRHESEIPMDVDPYDPKNESDDDGNDNDDNDDDDNNDEYDQLEQVFEKSLRREPSLNSFWSSTVSPLNKGISEYLQIRFIFLYLI